MLPRFCTVHTAELLHQNSICFLRAGVFGEMQEWALLYYSTLSESISICAGSTSSLGPNRQLQTRLNDAQIVVRYEQNNSRNMKVIEKVVLHQKT